MTESDTTTSPEELSSTNRTVVIEPSSITVNVSMSRATEYAKEKKEVNTFLKASIPVGIEVFSFDEEGRFILSEGFQLAADDAIRTMMNLCEVAAARQHGLDFVADDAGIVRVVNLFPGAKAGPAPAVQPGSFTAPAAVAAAPAAAAPVAAAPLPVAAPAPGAPGSFPTAPVPGVAAPAAPMVAAPAVAAPPAAPGGFTQTKSTNPARWSYYDEAAQAQLIAVLEAWVIAGGTGAECKNRMVAGEKYPGVDVNGIQISAKTLQNKGGPQTKAWIAQCVAGGIQLG